MSRVTLSTLKRMKAAGERFTVLTAYDASFARVLDEAGVDVILVGDSLGMVVQGFDSTLPVSLAHMVYHTQCVARGSKRALVMADMPFMSYQSSPEQALASAGRLLQKGGAHMVKLEGGEVMAPTVRFLVERGVAVCGHIGLTPQSVHQLGGYRVQGRGDDAARLKRDARALVDAGAGVLLLEAVPAALAAEITRASPVPTIGIGAGKDCDAQVLVLHDLLGIYSPPPKFAKNFLAQGGDIASAVKTFVADVRAGRFPAPEHSFE